MQNHILIKCLFLKCLIQFKDSKKASDKIAACYEIGYWYGLNENDSLEDEYVRSGISLAGKHQLPLEVARGYYFLAEGFYFRSENDSAVYYADRCIELYNKVKTKTKYYVGALNILSSALLDKGKVTEALKSANYQLEIATALRDTGGLSTTYTLLCAIYESIEDKTRALEYARKSLELDKASGAYENLVQALCNLALLYMEGHEVKKAMPLLHDALDFATHKYPSERDRAIAQLYLGQCYHYMEMEDSAYIYFNLARQIIPELSDPDLSLRMYEAFAEVSKKAKKFDLALENADKGVVMAKHYNLLDHYAYCLDLKSGILAAMGRYREAYEQHLAFVEINDSLGGLKLKKSLAEIRIKYNSEKKDEKIAQQKKVNKILFVSLLLILLFAIIALIQYLRQRSSTKTIRHQSLKLNVMMKELHHRVKNNLQIISSLLSLQSFRIKDSIASQAVRDGQQRIEAMSLIHQKLYTHDNITSININEFLNDLVKSLQSAYGFTDSQVDVLLDVDLEMMDVDKAIPLSLIVNELVSNAFKYAFKYKQDAELTISLKMQNEQLVLCVADNGPGLNPNDWKYKEGTFGKELIQTFVKQLKGKFTIELENGTRFIVIIPYKNSN